MQRKIIHIDMDCFYAAIEIRDNSDLAEVPLAVGGTSDRSVLCTANYLARKYGVRAAMPTVQAKKLCPELVLIYPDIDKYREVAKAIRKIFLEYTDLVEPLSLDEAYLDVSECRDYRGIATLIAEEIRSRIFIQEKLTASAGIAPNKFLAKVASDWRKPNAQFVIPPQRVEAFIQGLPIEKIFGVGKVTASKLKKQGWHTCKDLQQVSINELIERFGKFGKRLYFFCRGEDDRVVEPHRQRKTLSVEHTYEQDKHGFQACFLASQLLYEELKQRLLKYDEMTVHKQFIKIKFNNFQQTTVEQITDHLDFSLFQVLLYRGLGRHTLPVRLLGMGVAFLQVNPVTQLEIF